LFVFCAALFSFTGKFGGDVLKFYLNNKLISQQFVTARKLLKHSTGSKCFTMQRSCQLQSLWTNGKDRYISQRCTKQDSKKNAFADAVGD